MVTNMSVSSSVPPNISDRREYSNLRKKYISYLIPSVFSHIAFALNEFVDSMVVANLLDSRALSVISIAGPVTFLFTALYGLIGSGASTLYSICRGNHDRSEADALFSVSICVSAFISILLTGLGLLFTPRLSVLLGGRLGLENELSGYLRYLFLSAPPIILTSVYAYFLPIGGHPVLASVVCLVANVVNLICDYIYIGVLDMGVKGASLATLTGFSFGLLIVMIFAVFKSKDIGRFSFSFGNSSRLGSICATGASYATGQIGYAIKYAFCNYIAGIYAGQSGVVAFSICMQIASIISIFIGSFCATMIPFLGTLFGMNDRSGLKNIIKLTNCLQLISGISVFLLLEIKPEILTTMYAVEAGLTADIVIRAIRIFSILLLIRWIYLQFKDVAIVLGFRLYAMLIGLADAFIFLIPFILILCPLMGIDGLWWAFVISSATVTAGVFIINRIIAARSDGKYKGFWLIGEQKNIVADLTFRAEPGEVERITLKIEQICREHGMSMSRAMLASISVEEMIVIISRFSSSAKAVPMDVLIHKNAEEILIDVISIGNPFNPTKYADNSGPDSFEMLRRLSRSVTYDYMLGMNTTRIVIPLMK